MIFDIGRNNFSDESFSSLNVSLFIKKDKNKEIKLYANNTNNKIYFMLPEGTRVVEDLQSHYYDIPNVSNGIKYIYRNNFVSNGILLVDLISLYPTPYIDLFSGSYSSRNINLFTDKDGTLLSELITNNQPTKKFIEKYGSINSILQDKTKKNEIISGIKFSEKNIKNIIQPVKTKKEYNISKANPGRLHKLDIAKEIQKSKNGETGENIANEFLIKKYKLENIKKVSDINDELGYDYQCFDGKNYIAYEIKSSINGKSFNLSINEFECLYENKEKYILMIINLTNPDDIKFLNGIQFLKKFPYAKDLHDLLKKIKIDGSLKFNIE